MIEVTIHSIRVSLISHHRVVVLQELVGPRVLPIWIGPFEADAITIGLQGVDVARPLTHDLVQSIVHQTGAIISHVVVNDLRDDTFYACIVLNLNGQQAEVDCRPSDGIAVAVRAHVPIYVAERVMDQAGIVPEPEREVVTEQEEQRLAAFRDFVETLDLDELDKA